MYPWIWRHLPGPTAVRALLALVLVVAVTVALFLWVFPWLEPRLPWSDVTVNGSATPVVHRFVHTLGMNDTPVIQGRRGARLSASESPTRTRPG